MSNASLKDQLMSMGLSSTQDAPQKVNPKKMKQSAHLPEKSAKKQPAWLEQARYGVELLKAHFPKCFKELKDVQPLKVGIKQDLVKHLSTREDIVIGDKACMVTSLAYYVNSIAYHKSMVEKAVRMDLEGNPSGEVTTEEAQYSIDCRKTKLQKKPSNSQESSKASHDKQNKT